jgi:hypothetical protein
MVCPRLQTGCVFPRTDSGLLKSRRRARDPGRGVRSCRTKAKSRDGGAAALYDKVGLPLQVAAWMKLIGAPPF